MKNIAKYIFMPLAILMFGCSESFDEQVESTGSVEFDINVGTKATITEEDIPSSLLSVSTMRIYDSGGTLIRRYSPVTECPETLQLVEGSYTVNLILGNQTVVTTSTDDLTYSGSASFNISSDTPASVNVVCYLANTLVSVELDDSVDSGFEEGYTITVAAASEMTEDILSSSYTDKLVFTADGDEGYILMPDDVTTLAWQFDGTKKGDGAELSLSGVINNVKSAEEYELSFSYDKYLSMANMQLTVNTVTDDYYDQFNFSPQPIINCSGFEATVTQDILTDTTLDLSVSAMYDLSYIKVSYDNDEIARLDVNWIDDENVVFEDATQGIKYVASKSTAGVLTLSETLFDGVGMGGEQSVKIQAYDIKNSPGTCNILARVSGVTEISNEDFWTGVMNVSALVLSDEVSSVTIEVSEDNGSTWSSYAAKSNGDNTYTATTSGTTWSSAKTNAAGLTYYTIEGGANPNSDYQCRVVINNARELASATLTSGDTTQAIADGNMNDSDLACYTNDNGGSTWDSGNNSWASSLCKQATVNGAVCAKLSTSVVLNNLAAGNLFYGSFKFNGALAQTGTVSFGRSFTWTARPRSLKVKYAAIVGQDAMTVNGVSYSHDRGRIFLAIVDWSSQQQVTSGSGTPSGVWDPETQTSADGGKIIGYASYFIDESTASTSKLYDLEIPVYYYDTATKPSGNYTIVLSCASSAYGDYMTGTDGSTLYVDDFEFGY